MDVLAVVNQKGGVGKTALTAAIAAEISKTKKVVLLDLDSQSSLTGWCFNYLPVAEVTKCYQRLLEANSMTFLRGKTSFNESQIQITENLSLIGANIELSKITEEFSEYPGKELILQGLIQELRVGTNKLSLQNTEIIIDTPGDLSLSSVLALASASKLMIPVSTSFFAVDALKETLRRIGQVQSRINPDLRHICLVPSMHRPNRITNSRVLQILQEDEGLELLLIKNQEDDTLVIEDRAEMEKFLYSNEPFKNGSVLNRQIKNLCKGLYG